MDKIKQIRIKMDDGSFSNYDIGVLGENVEIKQFKEVKDLETVIKEELAPKIHNSRNKYEYGEAGENVFGHVGLIPKYEFTEEEKANINSGSEGFEQYVSSRALSISGAIEMYKNVQQVINMKKDLCPKNHLADLGKANDYGSGTEVKAGHVGLSNKYSSSNMPDYPASTAISVEGANVMYEELIGKINKLEQKITALETV